MLDQVQTEPVDIHPEFMKLVQLLLQANKLQKAFQDENSAAKALGSVN